jgi:hypothetical protein
VSGAGATSSLTYNVKTGYAGTLGYSVRGLQAATKFDNHIGSDPACVFDTENPDAMVAAGKATMNAFTMPAGASIVRFQTFQSDATPSIRDLDMFVYRAAPPAGSPYLLVTGSGGPNASEIVTSTSAASLTPGVKFKVYMHGCDVDPAGGDFTLFAWALTSPSSNPFTTVPATQAVTIGQSVPVTFSWTGLPAGNRYFGRVVYNDGAVGIGATQIEVSTR